MTEEIIIDGVNISECCFYNNGKCDNPNGMACNCINNAVCYFKQLKRLKQENERLRKANQISIEKVTVTADAKAVVKLEDELKELNERFDKECLRTATLAIENIKLEQENKELKSALEEVRKIAENAKENRYTTKSDDYTEGMETIGHYVMDKITEVLK